MECKNMQDRLPIQLLQYIQRYGTSSEQISFKQCCKRFYEFLYITNMSCQKNVTNGDIIKHKKLLSLSIVSGEKITDEAFANLKLKHLNISMCEKITDEGITTQSELITFICTKNNNITDVSITNAKKLKYLSLLICRKITGTCIFSKNLTHLDLSNSGMSINKQLENLPHLRFLRIEKNKATIEGKYITSKHIRSLIIYTKSDISSDCIHNMLLLKMLILRRNKANIKNLTAHNKRIRTLILSYNNVISDEDISGLPLTRLVIPGGQQIPIECLGSFPLKKLKLRDRCNINDSHLQCSQLEMLEMNHNTTIEGRNFKYMNLNILNANASNIRGEYLIGLRLKKLYINDCNFILDEHIMEMKNLKKLSIRGIMSKITDKGIRGKQLIVLYAGDNENITDDGIKNMPCQTLDASGCCGITDNGIKQLPKLTRLVHYGNKKITIKIPNRKS